MTAASQNAAPAEGWEGAWGQVTRLAPRRCLQTDLPGILISLTALVTRTQLPGEETGPGKGEGLSLGTRATRHSPAESTHRSRPQASVLASLNHRQSSGATIRHAKTEPRSRAKRPRATSPPGGRVLLQEGRTPDAGGWGAGCSLSALLFSLFRTLLAFFLISVVSCSRSSLVSG